MGAGKTLINFLHPKPQPAKDAQPSNRLLINIGAAEDFNHLPAQAVGD